MAGNHGAIHLNGPQKPQEPQGVPPLAGGRQAGPPPAQMHQPPAVPRTGFPVDMGRGPSVQISDVSRDLLTIDDMRNQLTEYAIFRFEKMPVQNTYEDDGRMQVPTWDRAIRTRVPDMAPREVARQIQHLNRDTRSLVDKRKSLSPVLQRQVDTAQEQLASQNPDPINYHWVLVQLDHQLREIIPYTFAAGGTKSLSRRRHGSHRRHSYSRASGRTRRVYERISLTAYFKRTPRPNVDIAMLYETRRSRNNQVVHPHPQPPLPPQPQPQPQPPQAHQQPHPHLQPHLRPDQRAQPPGVGPGAGAPLGPNGVRGPAPAVPHHSRPGHGGKPINNVGDGKNKDGRRNHDDFETDSEFSECSSSDGSVDTQLSPNTSQSSGSLSNGRSRGRDPDNRNTAGRRDGGRHGRVSPKRTQYIDTRNGVRIPHTTGPPPRLPAASPIDVERVRDAYLAGARDERENARMSEQQRASRGAQRLRPRPRIIPEVRSPISPYRRRSTASSDPEGYRRREDLDDEMRRFGRLSLDDEGSYDPVLRRADARRRREYEYLLQHGSVLDDDPFDRDVSSYSRHRSGHGGRRYEEPYLTDGSESDYTLSPRNSMHFRY
ncbi:hypothetical protein F5Y05DRAFT_406983 [Hypoxylon sp. FL0543]|nr:hypothetical protein F5Y05DRAFT_406983 [Hypoxylon sp. FL0543]